MDFFESGIFAYQPHYGWDYDVVTEYTYSRYSDTFKGLAILKTVPPYASEAQILDKFHLYAIVGGDGTPLVIEQSGVYSINAWGMEHSIVKRGEASEVYYNTTLYEVIPTHALPYPQAPDYWDGNLYISASLPIFDIDTQAGLDAFNLYQLTGDYSGADNYNDLPHDADPRGEIYFNTLKVKGIRGYKGNVGICDEIPVGALIAYDGDDLPEGYANIEETPPPPTAEITHIYGSGTGGTENIEMQENGVYLMICAYTYQGGGSITLPAGVTPIYSHSEISSNRGFIMSVAELEAGDVVSLYSFASSWVGHTKAIFKLDNINLLGNQLYEHIVLDGTENIYSSHLGTFDNALCVGVASGRTINDVDDYTDYNGGGALWHDTVLTNTLIIVNYVTPEEMPVYSYKGYDGGFAAFIAIE